MGCPRLPRFWVNARVIEPCFTHAPSFASAASPCWLLQVFGSFANGLSTWNSDLDLVVTGVMEPDRVTGCELGLRKGRVVVFC